MAFEIAFGRHVVALGEKRGFVRRQEAFDLRQRPDIEFAFFALGIRVEGCAECALRREHFAFEPADGFGGPVAKQRMAGARVGERQKFEKLGVVVKHLLEMRDQPALID